MNERPMFLNELSQGRRPVAEGVEWFTSFGLDDQRQVIREVSYLILQAKATGEEVASSFELAGIKPTMTPAVLLSHGPLREQLAKVGNLPEAEMEKSFRILIALLSLADGRRRREECVNDCSHWWHNL